MIDITLSKLKYRNPDRKKCYDSQAPGGFTWCYTGSRGGKVSTRTGNSHGPTPKTAKTSLRSRKRAYGPW